MRDDVAGALDAHAVADAKAEPCDFVAVVERDVGDDDAADPDGFQTTDWRELAGAADLNVDRFERRLGFLGGEFVRQRPPRSAGDLAQPLLPVQPLDFVDDAIDVVGQIGADALDLAIMRKHLLNVVAALQQVANGKAEGFDLLHREQLHCRERFAHFPPAMREEAQRASGRDRRVFLAQRASGSVARVGEDLAARRLLPSVQRLKVRFRHVHFAAHFQHVERVLNVLRNVRDRPRVGGDILADGAVAARCGENEFGALVTKRARQPVDLRFGGDRDRLVRGEREEAAHARDKLDHFRV